MSKRETNEENDSIGTCEICGVNDVVTWAHIMSHEPVYTCKFCKEAWRDGGSVDSQKIKEYSLRLRAEP